MADDGFASQASTTALAKQLSSSSKRIDATGLVTLAKQAFDLGVDTNGKLFGIRKNGHLALPLDSVMSELSGLAYDMTGKPVSSVAKADAREIIELEAQRSGEPRDLHLRSARPTDDDVYIDMGDDCEHVIHINGDGWEILDAADPLPVAFRRTTATAALPTPVHGGDLEALWNFVNVGSEKASELFKGWLVAACILIGYPCPLLALLGEQGTAKTSAARRLFALFDPTVAPVRRPPNDIDKLLHSAAHTRGVVYDNMSSIPRWLSDGMCRIVTGESDIDRALYTDDGIRIITCQAVIAITTIDVGSLSGDLAERTVWGDLKVIPASERRSERDLNAEWDKAYPSLVGGLLDLVSATLAALPDVSLTELPRMADFAEVLAAMDSATGSRALEYYLEAQESVAFDIVSTDSFLNAVTTTITDRWCGTGKELYNLLPKPDGEQAKYWPTERGISGKIRRVAPDLRKAGWEVEEIVPDPSTKRAKSWILVPPGVDQLTDAEIATVQLDVDFYQADLEQWHRRVLSDGATPACAGWHAAVFASGSPYVGTCGFGDPACQMSSGMLPAGYEAFLGRSRAIHTRMTNDLARIGLTLPEFSRIVADHAEQEGS